MKTKTFLFASMVFLLASCIAAQTSPTAAPQTNMSNPASAYCEERGNRLEIRTAPDGSQSGVCIFPDGSECDEWAYFRGECEPGAAITDTPGPSPYDGWMEYVESNYGFKFRYPPEWTAELDMRSDSTTYQHLIWLRAPSKPVDGVQMMIAFEHIGENYGIQRTGIGAGELIERGSVNFLGEPATRIVLVFDGKDAEVMYGTTGAFERGDLRFAISLSYVGVERLGLTPELEQVADLIVASFELTP
ncbi:MAG: DUF333 domain-containing protein [Chloroflexota bacterium]